MQHIAVTIEELVLPTRLVGAQLIGTSAELLRALKVGKECGVRGLCRDDVQRCLTHHRIEHGEAREQFRPCGLAHDVRCAYRGRPVSVLSAAVVGDPQPGLRLKDWRGQPRRPDAD